MKTRSFDYQDGDVACIGHLAEPDGSGPFPAVLVVHEAPGLTDHPKRRAAMLAELGYVALAADMYGDGAQPIPGQSPAVRMGPLMQDREALRRRARAALHAMTALPNVDASKIAAIGYCFGGSTVIELARGGTALNGVASFHGGLKTPSPAQPGAIRTKMLLCTGAEDPSIPPADRAAVQEELTQGGADWQMIVYSGAKHAFTNTDAPPIEGFGYQAEADRRSWAHLMDFFGEIFA